MSWQAPTALQSRLRYDLDECGADFAGSQTGRGLRDRVGHIGRGGWNAEGNG